MRKRRGSTLTIFLVVAAGLILLLSITLPFVFVLGLRFGGLTKATGTGGSGYGCFVADSYFTDTSLVSSQEAAIQTLENTYPNAKDNDKYVREVFSRGAQEGINPVIPLAIWSGEQSFGHPEKAFGYGYTDSGTLNGVTAWGSQLNGVYHSLHSVVNNTSPYNQPSGANLFTRLFYNYTTAMKNAYLQAGNVWNESTVVDGSTPVKNRLAIVRLLQPEAIQCQQSSTLVAATTGNNNVPLLKQGDFPQEYGQSGNTIAHSGCCVVSATMVLDFYHMNVDPILIGNFSYSNNCYLPDGNGNYQGTNTSCLFSKLAKQYNLQYKDIGNNWSQAIQYLQQGHPLLAHGKGSGPFTSGGHCIVITGYNSDGTFNINNPANTGNGPYSQSQLQQAGIAGMFYLGQ